MSSHSHNTEDAISEQSSLHVKTRQAQREDEWAVENHEENKSHRDKQRALERRADRDRKAGKQGVFRNCIETDALDSLGSDESLPSSAFMDM